ncbi:MAG: translation initiation factor IF-3 [Bdellovibrionota bacterium]
MKSSFGGGPRPPFGGGGAGGPRPSGDRDPRDNRDSRFNNDENRVNERIRVPEVFVIDENGVQVGAMPTREALAMARERGLDLVEVAATARPPVCKLLDYGKMKYSKKKKTQEDKKKQSVVTVKEIQHRPRTEEHDLLTKFNHITDFLLRGDKVKITVMFRGREVAYAQQGQEMLRRLIKSVEEFAVPESYPKLEGRRMIMVLGPSRNFENYKKVPKLVDAAEVPTTVVIPKASGGPTPNAVPGALPTPNAAAVSPAAPAAAAPAAAPSLPKPKA